MITSDKVQLEESLGRSGTRLSASELARTTHAELGDGLTPDESRGFERGIRTMVQGVRQSMGFEQDSKGHAVPAPVQQQAIQRAAGHEREGATHQVERGQGHGISW